MGFGEIAGSLIMFIAIVSTATILAFMFSNYTQATTSTIASQQQALNEQLKTSITIEHVFYDNNQLQMYVRNTGKSILRPQNINIFVGNQYINKNSSNTSVEILPDTDTVNIGLWDPKELLQIITNITLPAQQSHTIIITTEHGVRAQHIITT
ncbi:MAG: hypothetical protein ACMXYC_03325 [Candidatus Woesearchaeota archaeon]